MFDKLLSKPATTDDVKKRKHPVCPKCGSATFRRVRRSDYTTDEFAECIACGEPFELV